MPSTLMTSPSTTTEVEFQGSTILPWVVCFCAALYFFFEFMQVNMFNALTPSLFQTFHIDSVRLSKVWFCYNFANVLFLLPAGMVLDRISTRVLIIAAMSVSVICTFGISEANAVWQIEVLRFITGIAGAFCFLSSMRLATRWFPPHRMAMVIGLIVTFAMAGGLLAQTPFTMMVDTIGWRETVGIDAAMGAVMLIVIVIFVKDFPPGYDRNIQTGHELPSRFWPSLWEIIKKQQNWMAGIYASLMNLPIFILGALWGSLYLVEVRQLTHAKASFVVSMIFIGTMIGSPVLGWVSDTLKSRRMPMMIGALISTVFVFILMYAASLSLTSLLIIFFMIGFVTSVQIIPFPLIAESNPSCLTGTAEGLGATLIMGGGFMTTVFAWLMNLRWNHHIVDSIPIYSASNFRWGFAIMPIAFIIAFLATFVLKETHCISYENKKENA